MDRIIRWSEEDARQIIIISFSSTRFQDAAAWRALDRIRLKKVSRENCSSDEKATTLATVVAGLPHAMQ